MTAVRLALLELRRFRGQPIRYLALSIVVLVPLLYGSLYLWANWDPYGKTDQVPVAVVNEDTGATVDGRELDAGTEFVDQLKSTPDLDWNFVSAQRAADGMDAGDYYFAIVVPQDFSTKLATLAGTDPERAYLSVKLDDANGYVAGIMAATMEVELQNQINTAVYVTFAKSIFGDLTELGDGLNDAADGAADLADGAQAADEGADELAGGLDDLGDGASQVADGVGEINTLVQSVDDLAGSGSQTVKDDLDTLQADLEAAADECEDDPLPSAGCDAVETAVETAATVIPNLKGKIDNANEEISTKADDVAALDTGANQVADGLNAEGGARDGANQLADGTQKLADGADELSGSLSDAAAKVPSMNAEENARAADVLGSPVTIKETNEHPADVYGRGLAPFFFAIALWVFGLVAFLLLRTANPRAMAGKVSSFTVAMAGWLPSLFLGIIAALLLYLVVDVGLGLDPVNVTGTVGLFLLAIAAFSAIAHFLRLALDAVGDVLLLVFLMLQLTSSGGLYPLETSPVFFQVLHPLLPMSYLVDGLRITISGGNTAHLWQDVAVLAGFTVAAVLASTLVTMRQRRWSMRRMRPAVEL